MDPGPDEYEEVQFHEPASEVGIERMDQLLSEKQQVQMLYTIKMASGVDKYNQNQNLLDLTCEETNPRTSRSVDYRDFMEDRVVQLSSPITIQEGYLISYKLYKVKSKKRGQEEFDTIVERRYSDFQYLHNRLIQNYGGFLVPRLPDKSVWASLNMETAQYIKNRKHQLQKYLEKLLSHHKLKYSQELVLFLLDPQNNFSQKKGEHVSNSTIEDSIYRLTSTAFETTTSLLTKYFNPTPLSSFSISSLSLSSDGKQKYRVKPSKQDQEILHYEIIVNGLTDVVKQIKAIVENTCQEGYCVSQFAQISQELLKEDNQSRPNKLKGNQGSNIYDRNSQQMQVGSESNIYTHLLDSYENLFELIQCCKQAINRRNKLTEYLWLLKEEEEQLLKKSRSNPRNINLDIVRSKIQQATRKYDQFTEDLLEELDMQVMMSKSMIGLFVKELIEVRATLYEDQTLH